MAKRDPITPSPLELAHIQQEALEFANIGSYRYLFNGTILFIDKGARKIFDLDESAPDLQHLEQMNITELAHFIGPRRKLRADDLVAAHGFTFEDHFRSLAGKEKWVSCRASLVKDPKNNSEAIQAIIQDISSRKRTELVQNCVLRISEAVLKSENLTSLYSAIHTLIRQLMPANNFYIALYNQEARTLSFPYFVDEYDEAPPTQKLRRGLTEYVLRTGKALLATPSVFADLVRQGEIEPLGAESIDWMGVPLKSRDETIGILAIQSYNDHIRLFNDDRDLLLYVSNQIAMAIERKRTEEALRESEDRFSAFMDYMPAGTFITDANNKLLYVNRFMASTFDIGEWTGKIVNEVLPAAIIDRNESEHVLAGGLHTKEDAYTNSDGMVQVFQTLRFPILRSEKPALLAGIALDITQRKRAEEQVQKQLHKLAALRNIDQAINLHQDLNVTLDVLLEQVLSQLKVDAADVLLLVPGSDMLEFSTGRGFSTGSFHFIYLDFGKDLAWQAVSTGKRVHMDRLDHHLEKFARAELLRTEGFKAYFAVPLISNDKVKGVLEVFHRSKFEPDQEWLDFFEAIAMQAAIAASQSELINTLKQTNTELVAAYNATIESLAQALELRDLATVGHTRRVAEKTMQLGRRMGLSGEELVHLERGALLHDIGKIAIPDNILLKPGPLSKDEVDIIRQHPIHAYKLLLPIPFLRQAVDIPYCHHEKWDGTGYPRQLNQQQIPLSARIFAAVDVWDALTSDRPYRRAWPDEKAIKYIQSQACTFFDPEVVNEFMKMRADSPTFSLS